MKLFYDVNNIKRFDRDEKNINGELNYDNEEIMKLISKSFQIFGDLDISISTNFVQPKPTYTTHEQTNFDFKYGIIEALTNPRIINELFYGFGTLDHKPVMPKAFIYNDNAIEKLKVITEYFKNNEIPYTINKDCTLNVKYSFCEPSEKVLYTLNIKIFPKGI